MSAQSDVQHSSARHDWRTPDALVELVKRCDGFGDIDLDPCASVDFADWFARTNRTRADDGLTILWEEHIPVECLGRGEPATVFVNSEYGRALPAWVDKCAASAYDRMQVVQLAPNRPGVKWYRAALAAASAMCSLDGRLTFKGAPAAAPFPSALFYYGPRPYRFADVFQDHGDVRVML